MKAYIRRYWPHALCIALLPSLNGCLLLPVAAVGLGGVKLVQMSMKSTFEVTFDPPSIENKNGLAGINRIALWPESKGQASAFNQGEALVSAAMLSEHLSSSVDTVTARAVLQVLASNSMPLSLQDLTGKERLEACKLICDRTGADAVVCASPPDMKVDSRFFSLKRSSRTYGSDIQVYSRAKDDVVWRDLLVVTVKQGSTEPSATDIEQAVAAALGDRLLELTGKKAVPEPVGVTNAPAPQKIP